MIIAVDYIQEYRKFVNSYNVTDALRMTVGIALPALVLGYFNHTAIGLLASLGAMTVSTADIPGPIQRRFNGMLVTLILNFLIATLVRFCNTQPVILGIVIALLCFVLSLLGIYGNRVSAIGFAGLMVMVLSLDRHQPPQQIILSSLYLVSGGIWYMLLSLALFRMRPFLIVQQALGDSIISIGDYLKTRAYFYDEDVDYDKTYKKLMLEQHQVHDKQELLREMIFKSRSVVRQSTKTGRTLLIIFLESIDLFEKATATVYNYKSMHEHFGNTEMLSRFKSIILLMVEELHKIGLAVQSGQPSKLSKHLNNELHILKTDFEKFIDANRSPKNIAPLINMRKIMQAIEDMVIRIYTLHHYTRYSGNKIKDYILSDNYDSFVPSAKLEWPLLWENLSLSSNNFRHALRVSIATTVGYTIALLLNLGYSYWVLLTILVILKPSYSLTKQRNIHRLIGTIIGALAGIGLLFLVSNEAGRLAVIVLLMFAAYSFFRTNYFIGVVFMTAYVLIFFYLIDSKNFVSVFENRVIDTITGSVIAFLATYILVPTWEKEHVIKYMQQALEKSAAYLKTVEGFFAAGNFADFNYRLSRKDAFVAQANLSSGFNRMMNEPKSKQGNAGKVNEFIVLIYTLNSHIASLADFAQKFAKKYKTTDFNLITEDIITRLTEAKNFLQQEDEGVETHAGSEAAGILKQEMKELVEKRTHELQQGLMDTETKTTLIELKPIVDQFLFISRLSGDINKVAASFYTKK